MTDALLKVIVSVKVSDGSFESDVSWPIAASEAERRAALDLWIAMLERAITVGRGQGDAHDNG